MAHTKAKGSSKLGRDSQAKRLGVKKYTGEKILAGGIIIRQKGTKYHPGENVALGKDFTIFATANGTVQFKAKKIRKFNGQIRPATIVGIVKESK